MPNSYDHTIGVLASLCSNLVSALDDPYVENRPVYVEEARSLLGKLDMMQLQVAGNVYPEIGGAD